MTEQEKEEILKEIPNLNWKLKEQINTFKSLMDGYTFDRLKSWLYDLKEDFQKGYIKNPPGVFLYWLQTDMGTKKLEKKTKVQEIEIYKPHKNIEQVQEEISKNPEIAAIELPSRKNGIELPKILSDWPFFTLSTNKNRSDEIKIKIKTEKGIAEAILVRGIPKRGLQEHGILSAFDGRVFSAVISLWQKKGCSISKITFKENQNNQESASVGGIKITIQELLVELNITKTGPNEKIILNSLMRLRSKPYALYTTDGIFIGSFSLLYGVDLSGIKKGRPTDNTGIYITLSPQITAQFYYRHSLPFSKGILQLKSELAYLIWLYIEPMLEKIKEPIKIPLQTLINELHLPKNKMYKYKSQRKQVFEQAIENLKGIKTSRNKQVIFYFEENINDWNLVFGLSENFPKELTA